jgi:hypothetical protein
MTWFEKMNVKNTIALDAKLDAATLSMLKTNSALWCPYISIDEFKDFSAFILYCFILIWSVKWRAMLIIMIAIKMSFLLILVFMSGFGSLPVEKNINLFNVPSAATYILAIKTYFSLSF